MLRLIPGPTRVEANVLQAHAEQVGSSDVEDEFWDDYLALESKLQTFLSTRQHIAIQSGEGMVALWGALKSTLLPGDRVVCGVNGFFGEGFASMAKALGADVHVVESDWTKPLEVQKLMQVIKETDPRLVTMVHCETPTGLLNDLEGIGHAVHEHTSNGLFLVDFVSSALGAPLQVDDLEIDLGLLAPQKCLSAPPALAFTSVSERAWLRIREVKYAGYDALLPFDDVANQFPRLLPYTHNWNAVKACLVACNNLEEQGGVQASIKRHAQVAAFCRQEITHLGLQLFCANDVACSPTVTAVQVPETVSWKALDKEMQANGVRVGGSYGAHAGKVFRIGHMGTQADQKLVAQALGVLSTALRKLR